MCCKSSNWLCAQKDEFNLTAFPRYMTRPIISRYDVGMFYKGHVDKPVMHFMDSKLGLMPLGSNYVRTDLSMTLFLNDPASYDGCELSFEAPFSNIKVKLDAGSAVVYPTGSRHQVLPVTRGRQVCSDLLDTESVSGRGAQASCLQRASAHAND